MSINDNRYISVYKVLRKGELMVVYTTVFSMIISMIITGIVAWLTESVILSILLMIFSIIIVPIFVWQHQLVKWKIWAFSRVNNIPKLLLRADVSLLRDDNLLITKTIIPYRKRKKEIEEILWNRKHSNLFEVELTDTFLPAQKHIYYSFTRYAMLLLVGVILLYAAFQVPEENESGLIFIKILVLAVSIFFFYFSIKRLINRKPIITIDSKGIYTIKSGFINWKDIKRVDVGIIVEFGKQMSKILRLDFIKENNLQSIKYNIETLSVSVIELDEIIEIYRNRNIEQQ